MHRLRKVFGEGLFTALRVSSRSRSCYSRLAIGILTLLDSFPVALAVLLVAFPKFICLIYGVAHRAGHRAYGPPNRAKPWIKCLEQHGTSFTQFLRPPKMDTKNSRSRPVAGACRVRVQNNAVRSHPRPRKEYGHIRMK